MKKKDYVEIHYELNDEIEMNLIIRKVIRENLDADNFQFNIACAEALNKAGFRTKNGAKFTNRMFAVYKFRRAFGPKSDTWGETA